MNHKPGSKQQVSTRWALLIGINHYLEGKGRLNGKVYFGHLHGCVNDVIRMERYLHTVGNVNIAKLTSTASNVSNQKPQEDENRWPTHANVIRELSRIYDSARRGDLVYIHYSGHGISRKSVEIHDKGEKLDGTALAMMDVNAGGAYLSGYQLGVHVKRMVREKGLRVTVVLDSCFSGEAFREQEDSSVMIRTSDFGFDDSQLPSDIDADRAARVLDPEHEVTRQAIVEESWLSRPVGTAVICACDRDQGASEGFLADAKGRTGYLTHWILDMLGRYPTAWPPSHARLRGYVAQQLELQGKNQTPIVHGEGFYQFFGNRHIIQRPECTVSSTSSGIVLDIGKAQGAAVGARYHVYPQNCHFDVGPIFTDGDPRHNNLVEVEISEALDLKSHVTLVPTSGGTPGKIKKGDRAIPYRWAFGRPIYIQLMRMPSSLIKSLRTAIEEIPGLKVAKPGLVNLVITADIDGAFMLFDNNKNPIKRIPKIGLEDPEAIAKMMFVVRHLARFDSVRSISHISPRSLAATAGVHAKLLDASGRQMTLDTNAMRYLVRENQTVTVSVQNLGYSSPIHITFLSLTSIWGIMKLSPNDGQPARSLSGRSPMKLTLKMVVPRRPGDEPHVAGGSDETIRVCICIAKYPVSWDELTLPALPVDAKNVWPVAPLEAFPAYASHEKRRDDDPVQVVGDVEEEPRREWMFLDFKIRTLPELTNASVSHRMVSRAR